MSVVHVHRLVRPQFLGSNRMPVPSTFGEMRGPMPTNNAGCGVTRFGQSISARLARFVTALGTADWDAWTQTTSFRRLVSGFRPCLDPLARDRRRVPRVVARVDPHAEHDRTRSSAGSFHDYRSVTRRRSTNPRITLRSHSEGNSRTDLVRFTGGTRRSAPGAPTGTRAPLAG